MTNTMLQPKRAFSVAETKQNLSELLGRVAFGRETLTILRRGRPMAKLVPLDATLTSERLADAKGWLDDDDPFFEAIGTIIKSRGSRAPRALGRRKGRLSRSR